MTPTEVLRLSLRLPLLGLTTTLPLPLLVTGRLLGGLGARRLGAAASHAAIGAWARGSLAVMGVRVSRSGAAPAPPFFLVANHLSYLDIVVLHAACRARFLSKAEIASWPVAGFLARLAGTLFIDRERRRDVSRAIPELQAAISAGDGVIVFPEGTSSAGKDVLPFHASLLQAPLQLGLSSHWARLAYRTPDGSQPAWWSVCWWGDMPFGSHFLKLLTLPSIEAELHFGPEPITAPDRKALAQELRSAIQTGFRATAPAAFDPASLTEPNPQ
ncbi:MAG: lysophospholipid acyltransferase family protein [Planctomycetota bacterium]